MRKFAPFLFLIVALPVLMGAVIGDKTRKGLSEVFAGTAGGTIGRPALAPLPANSALVAYYRYDDADVSAGTLANKAPTGSAYNQTLQNSPTSVAGTLGQARNFLASSSQRGIYTTSQAGAPWRVDYMMPSSMPAWTYVVHTKAPIGVVGVIHSSGNGTSAFRGIIVTPGVGNTYIISIDYFLATGYYNTKWTTPAVMGNFIDLVLTTAASSPLPTLLNTNAIQGGGLLCYVNGVACTPSTTSPNIGSFSTNIATTNANSIFYSADGNYYGNNIVLDEESWWNVQFSAAQASTIHSLRTLGISLKDWQGLP